MFLVFNMLLRATNRRISNARMSSRLWARVEKLYQELSEDEGRFQKAVQELQEKNFTSDKAVYRLLRELSIYGTSHPFSTDNKLDLRSKIESLNIRSGMFAIWFTLNPNDIDHPIKLMLVTSRTIGAKRAERTLRQAVEQAKATSRGFNDPVMAAVHFSRQIELFFRNIVRIGKPSIYGAVSNYFGVLETNDREALHLHGFLWLRGNHNFQTLSKDVEQNPELAAKTSAFFDNLLSESVDVVQGLNLRETTSTTYYGEEVVGCLQSVKATMNNMANMVATCRNRHKHCFSCFKYSYGDRKRQRNDASMRPRQQRNNKPPCRYRYPKNLYERTHWDEKGVLRVRRNHRMVGKWNRVVAAALRCNQDISFVLGRKRAYAQTQYAIAYGTKGKVTMFDRLASAAKFADSVKQQLQAEDGAGDGTINADAHDPVTKLGSKARVFWNRLANKIFSDTQVSSVEVATYLLGLPLYYCNVMSDDWQYLDINALFWATAKRWEWLKDRINADTKGEDKLGDDKLSLTLWGKRLGYIDAYEHRGLALRDVCLYDYVGMILLQKRKKLPTTGGVDHIAFDNEEYNKLWTQKVRKEDNLGMVQLKGLQSLWKSDIEPKGVSRYVINLPGRTVPLIWAPIPC